MAGKRTNKKGKQNSAGGRKNSRKGSNKKQTKTPTPVEASPEDFLISPDSELRQRLVEASIDVKENIPEATNPNPTPQANNSAPSSDDLSARRKRRSAQIGPAAKRTSIEKHDVSDSEDDVPSNSSHTTDERSSGSSKQTGVKRRPPCQPLPIVEEDEVFFDDSYVSNETFDATSSAALETPHVDDCCCDICLDEYEEENNVYPYTLQNDKFQEMESFLNRERSGEAQPPPQLTEQQCDGFGSPAKVWAMMLRRDEVPRATHLLFNAHPTMKASTRAMLVDWMMEVCETECQHRQTLHLAVDYVDRVLEAAPIEVTNKSFQLLGTAALFIASKFEEIYPPKCHEFANYTDGAFSAIEVLQMESVMVRALNWTLGPFTSVQWLGFYLHLLGKTEVDDVRPPGDDHVYDEHFTVPKLMREEFLHMAKILDLILLDVNSFAFSYRTLAAAVLFSCYEPHKLVEQVTGYTYERLISVVEYVEPAVNVMEKRRMAGDPLPVFDEHKVARSEVHTIQTHLEFENVGDAMEEVEAERMRLKPRFSSRSSGNSTRFGSSTPVSTGSGSSFFSSQRSTSSAFSFA